MDDDKRLTEVLDTDEKLINNGYTVCQDNEKMDELGEYETGDHFTFQKTENQIIFRIIQGSYYETLVWEERKGLVAFSSGFRVERDILYLTEITKTIVEG